VKNAPKYAMKKISNVLTNVMASYKRVINKLIGIISLSLRPST